MTDPVSEQIDQSMLAALSAITTGNGYNITLSSVVRYDGGNPTTPADLMGELNVGDDEPVADSDSPEDLTPIGLAQWDRPYWVIVYLLKNGNDPVPYQRWKNLAWADVQKAILSDRSRGNLTGVVDTYDRGGFSFSNPDDVRGVAVKFVVRYRTAENDPYSPG